MTTSHPGQPAGGPLVAGLDREHVAVMFQAAVAQFADRPCSRVRAGDGSWLVHTFAEVDVLVRQTARGLLKAGVQVGERVAIFARNLPEWTQVDLAIQHIGAVPVPIYATNTPAQIAHIGRDCGMVLAFAGSQSETERMVAAQQQLPALKEVISFEPTVVDGVASLAQFMAQANADASLVAELDAELAARLAQVSPDDLFSLIYTSGTTGEPRGVMLTQRAMISQVKALDEIFDIDADDHSLCFLPLSHALERGWTTYILSHGCLNTYLPDTRKAAETLVAVRPTLLVAVPKLYETVLATAQQRAGESGFKRRIFEWALKVGLKNQHAYRRGRRPRLYWRAQLGLANTLVLRNIRAAIGGPKKVMACGGAPLRPEVEEFFSAAGMQLFGGYGLTEACPLISFNRPHDFKTGTAGKVMAGGELRIGQDAEIQYRGPNVMNGYWHNPAATAEAFAPASDGGQVWLRTGDAGLIDHDGFLVVTDRIKDIIVTLGGKNIAPQPIEGLLLADPLFEQAVLLGDNRPFLTLLVRPSLPQLGAIADMLHEPYEQLSDLLSNPRITAEVRERAHKITEKLPSHEQFKDLRVLLDDFTMENGLLTPTLKVKRREVEKRFARIIDDMYVKLAELRARKDDPAPETVDKTGSTNKFEGAHKNKSEVADNAANNAADKPETTDTPHS